MRDGVSGYVVALCLPGLQFFSMAIIRMSFRCIEGWAKVIRYLLSFLFWLWKVCMCVWRMLLIICYSKVCSLVIRMFISCMFFMRMMLYFFGEWDAKNIKNLIRIFRIFYMASGLQINLHKSKIYRIRLLRSLLRVQVMGRI